MNKGLRMFWSSLVIGAMLSACAPSQAVVNATVTQIAANVFATETAQAPTITATFTASPTATSTPTSTLTPTPTDTPTPTLDPSILYEDDFSDPDSGWDIYSDANGKTEYALGGMHIYVSEPNYSYATSTDRTLINAIVEVDAHKIGGPDHNQYGVICRMLDYSNYYVFLIDSNGYYGIWKRIDDNWSPVSGAGWGFNDKVIRTGNGTNHFRVTCYDDNLTLEINGTILMDVTDSELKRGAVGLYAGAYDLGKVDILFEDFVLRKP